MDEPYELKYGAHGSQRIQLRSLSLCELLALDPNTTQN